jgi:hypothetical protein
MLGSVGNAGAVLLPPDRDSLIINDLGRPQLLALSLAPFNPCHLPRLDVRKMGTNLLISLYRRGITPRLG